jgi:hypothetical protein
MCNYLSKVNWKRKTKKENLHKEKLTGKGIEKLIYELKENYSKNLREKLKENRK